MPVGGIGVEEPQKELTEQEPAPEPGGEPAQQEWTVAKRVRDECSSWLNLECTETHLKCTR